MRTISSYYHTPGKRYRHLFHSVLRAGHIQVDPDHQLESWTYPGHDLLFCLEGCGAVDIAGRTFEVRRGNLCWVDYRRRPVAWPKRTRPWELLWMRVDSAQMDVIAEALRVDANALFVPLKPEEAESVFASIFRVLRNRPLTMDATLHAAVSQLVAIFFECHQHAAAAQWQTPREANAHADFGMVVETMRAEYQRRWKIRDLARLARMSEPQFFRRFSQATGSSPMDWLRRERANQAKRRLVETQDRISDIAEYVGYTDPLYFSRDFKKLVGVSPEHYRRQEQAKPGK